MSVTVDPAIIGIGQVITGGAAALAAFLSWQSARESLKSSKASEEAARQSERRTMILSLVDVMSPLFEIDPSDPDEDRIRKMLNAFEMTGHLIDANVLDEQLVELIWGAFITRNVQRISISNIKLESGDTPADLLRATPKAKALSEVMESAANKRIKYVEKQGSIE